MLKFVSLVLLALLIIKVEGDECSPPCNGICDECVKNPNIACITTPCQEYHCRKNETCLKELPDLPKNDICRLPAQPGMCLAYFRKFFFNMETKNCESFVYGGCQANENNFNTILECQRVCMLGQECPMVKLEAPRKGCRYDKDPAEDGCPKNDLVCDVKPGECPTVWDEARTQSCTHECHVSDSRCEGEKKCCTVGCNVVCLSPINVTISE